MELALPVCAQEINNHFRTSNMPSLFDFKLPTVNGISLATQNRVCYKLPGHWTEKDRRVALRSLN